MLSPNKKSKAITQIAQKLNATRQDDSIIIQNKYIFPDSFVIEIFEHFADCEIGLTIQYLMRAIKQSDLTQFPDSFREFIQS